MKRLILHRRYHGIGTLYCGDKRLYSLERPWIPDAPGGTPNLSCVPAGTYKLIAHTRPDGDDVLALVNPGLGVYYLAKDRPHRVGRYLILIHPANLVNEIAGCIAPGMGHAHVSGGEGSDHHSPPRGSMRPCPMNALAAHVSVPVTVT